MRTGPARSDAEREPRDGKRRRRSTRSPAADQDGIFRMSRTGMPGTRLGWPIFRINPEAERSEEHTSELQSQSNLVCRLLLEKKKLCNINIIFNLVLYYAVVTKDSQSLLAYPANTLADHEPLYQILKNLKICLLHWRIV